MCEWLKTVSLLKSETTNDTIKPKKLTTTKKSCKNVIKIILLSKILESLKFLIEIKIIKRAQQNPKISEYCPIKLAKIISPAMLLLLLGAYNFHHVLLKF